MTWYLVTDGRIEIACNDTTGNASPPRLRTQRELAEPLRHMLEQQLVTQPGHPGDLFADFRGNLLVEGGTIHEATQAARDRLQMEVNAKRKRPAGDMSAIVLEPFEATRWRPVGTNGHEVGYWPMTEDAEGTRKPWSFTLNGAGYGEYCGYPCFLLTLRECKVP